ncbi:MAG: hypothetical protein LBG19_12415 [Prevotellaceae bacterium]|jgi:opacity protein-like surface antigen|nr:hypothetical protein [Prevotellaceae bacterium]
MLKTTKRTIFISIFLFCGLNAIGQEDNSINTYSPYTLYGIGDISKPGSATTAAMGNVTLGIRDPFSIDYTNPASLSIRDTLSFLFDFGVMQKNTYAKTSTSKTSANNLNFDFFAFSFRIAKGLGFAAGVKTYSSVGYDIERRETDPYLIYNVGNILYQHKGEGSINMLFAGAGWRLSKNFSVGANFLYYFGSIERYHNILFTTNPYYSSIYSNNKLRVSKVSFSAGTQYHKQLTNNNNLVIGAAFRPKTTLSPKNEAYTSAISYTENVISENTDYINSVFVPMELGIGVSYNKLNKFTVGLDYLYEDWKDFNITGKSNSFIFDTDVNQTIRLGIDYIPNAYEIRKPMKRWNYRAGVYFSNTYMICNGERIKDYGITFGVGIPITRMGTRLNGAVEIGQRGTTSNGLIKETYVGFKISASIHELWFVKYKYR